MDVVQNIPDSVHPCWQLPLMFKSEIPSAPLSAHVLSGRFRKRQAVLLTHSVKHEASTQQKRTCIMNQYEVNMIRETSIKLPGGGDTHIHPWSSGSGFTVTTRLPGVPDPFHESFRFSQLNSAPTDPSGLKSLG